MTETLKTLDENFSVPFKIVVPLITAIILATFWIQSTLFKIQAAQNDFITRSEAAAWRDQLSQLNPAIKVPYTPYK